MHQVHRSFAVCAANGCRALRKSFRKVVPFLREKNNGSFRSHQFKWKSKTNIVSSIKRGERCKKPASTPHEPVARETWATVLLRLYPNFACFDFHPRFSSEDNRMTTRSLYATEFLTRKGFTFFLTLAKFHKFGHLNQGTRLETRFSKFWGSRIKSPVELLST